MTDTSIAAPEYRIAHNYNYQLTHQVTYQVTYQVVQSFGLTPRAYCT